jgi:hypothetical protein
LQFHINAYDRCTNLGEKNLADSVAIYGQGRGTFSPPTNTFTFATLLFRKSVANTGIKLYSKMPDLIKKNWTRSNHLQES